MAAVECTLIAVAMSDVAAADAAFEELVGCEEGSGLDVVTIGRNRSGVVRFDRESPIGGRATYSIAAGLAAALYPSVGSDLPGDRVAYCEVLAAVAGRIALVVGRTVLHELGEHLDTAPAALIAFVPSGARAEVIDTVGDERSIRSHPVALDVSAVERVATAARRSAGPRPDAG